VFLLLAWVVNKVNELTEGEGLDEVMLDGVHLALNGLGRTLELYGDFPTSGTLTSHIN
jgi:hypothetical protein